MCDFRYYHGTIKSQSHTPIYKGHKYFARRPHNVFRDLIRHYSKQGDIVLDPFGGGGVTLVEGLSENRRVITSDVNSVAAFIQLNQVANITLERFLSLAGILRTEVVERFGDFYRTECEKCRSQARVRWFEHAYLVKCPHCAAETELKDEYKAVHETGKSRNGMYTCTNCGGVFRSVDVERRGSRIITIRYLCDACGEHGNKYPNNEDHDKYQIFEEEMAAFKVELDLRIPSDEFPSFWDRQHEDALHRKGFRSFADLFTKRNLIVSAYFFDVIDKRIKDISEEEYWFLVYLVSSLLRYTNNMNFSTSHWMDGRPVAWAKHAYWLPNQFIEVNPIEYFDNRIKVFKSAIKDRVNRFGNRIHSFHPNDVLRKDAHYSVIHGDSSEIELPRNSIDFILTDPPYGSNVQYGELTRFWDVWLKNRSPFEHDDEYLKSEAVVHRRTKDPLYSKDFANYYHLLHRVFRKCFALLKPDGVMAFTFNNKDVRAWYTVIKAVIDAGFFIEPQGIHFQDGIHAYRDTAHMRFDGTPRGDFIYSFRKTRTQMDFSKGPQSLDECIDSALNRIVPNTQFGITELQINLFAEATLFLVKRMSEGASIDQVNELFATLDLKQYLDVRSDITREKNGWKRLGTSAIGKP